MNNITNKYTEEKKNGTKMVYFRNIDIMKAALEGLENSTCMTYTE